MHRLFTLPLLAALACSGEPAAPPTRHVPSTAPPVTQANRRNEAAAPSGPAAATTPPAPTPPASCGALDCKLYGDAASAFETVLADKPQVLAVGEMHALQTAGDIPSATRRFREELLPLLIGRASELLLELWVSDPNCKQAVAKVDTQQKEVTAGQAAGNPNEFVALGDAAHAVGIQPQLLQPTCKDYEEIAGAGDDAVILMLETIARLSAADLEAASARNQRDKTGKMVVAYGGAMHNDLAPAKGAETFSFGPAVAKKVGGRYVALDLVVPEYVHDSKLWRAQPWYEHFDPSAHPDKVRLYHPRDGEYALIFARTR